jgi:hypothetical protein
MSDYDDFLNLLLARKGKLSLIEWAKRDQIKNIPELTPYFIAYLYYPFDSKEKDSKEYGELKSKCHVLYSEIQEDCESGILHASRGCFTRRSWSFSLPDCPELERMDEIDRNNYMLKRIYPEDAREILTYFIGKDEFREWMEERSLPIKSVSSESLLWRWFQDEYPSFQFVKDVVEKELPKTFRSDKQKRIDALNRAWEKIQERAKEHGIELNRGKIPGRKEPFYRLVCALEKEIRHITFCAFESEYLKGEFKFSGTLNDPWSELFPEFMQSHDR